VTASAWGELESRVHAWIADDPDGPSRAELAALLRRAGGGDAAARNTLSDYFSDPLRFGTAGLRGPLRPGPAGMNTAVVRRSAAGIARYLDAAGLGARPVVIGFDARHGSASFARDSAAVFAAAGFDARLMPAPLPTPVLAYAVRQLAAVAGVMVTASHNPAHDNGYKVYGADGRQIVAPVDAAIEAEIGRIASASRIVLSRGYRIVAEELVESYVAAVVALIKPGGSRELRIVHTALHGVGTGIVGRVLAAAGFDQVIRVAEQAEPDPDFPSVAFPNPEEPGALDLAIGTAVASEADLILANDPDADRCAVAVAEPGGRWRMLRGDEVGVLLADRLIRSGRRGTYATTIVSSTMLAAMAAARGVAYAETLTGFKWITRAAEDLAFGYEEALGYAVAPELVADKDGISAALVIADMAAEYQAAGSSLLGRLEELALSFGRHLTTQLSWRVADLRRIDAAMASLRSCPAVLMLGRQTVLSDLMPAADVLIFRFDGGRVVVRPSGTEPKCKAYLEVVSTASQAETQHMLDALAAEVSELVGL
jgi:phosphomannomutase